LQPAQAAEPKPLRRRFGGGLILLPLTPEAGFTILPRMNGLDFICGICREITS